MRNSERQPTRAARVCSALLGLQAKPAAAPPGVDRPLAVADAGRALDIAAGSVPLRDLRVRDLCVMFPGLFTPELAAFGEFVLPRSKKDDPTRLTLGDIVREVRVRMREELEDLEDREYMGVERRAISRQFVKDALLASAWLHDACDDEDDDADDTCDRATAECRARIARIPDAVWDQVAGIVRFTARAGRAGR